MRRGLSSERIAQGLLRRLGFRILELHKRVLIGDAQVAEVDMVAESPESVRYCVEVKAGKAGVNDLRQVHGNAALLNLQPLLICKGYADRAAEAASKELKVRVIELPEYYHIVGPEELEAIVREAFRSVLDEYGLLPMPSRESITEQELRAMEAIASTKSLEEACKLLGLDQKGLGSSLRSLRRKGVLKPAKGYEELRLQAKRLLARLTLEERLERIEDRLARLGKALEALKLEGTSELKPRKKASASPEPSRQPALEEAPCSRR